MQGVCRWTVYGSVYCFGLPGPHVLEPAGPVDLQPVPSDAPIALQTAGVVFAPSAQLVAAHS